VDETERFFSCLGAGTLLLAAEEGGQGHVRHLHNLEPVKKKFPSKTVLFFIIITNEFVRIQFMDGKR
jgi:hypothetical protein